MLFNAIKSDKDFEKIFDFLSENCPMFNNTIHQQIRLYYKFDKNSPTAHNILYQAYLADNKKLFAALLKYGVNPFQPWVISENIAYPALYAIALNPRDTDFYINTLLDKGVTFTNNDPKVDLNSASSLRSIARTSTAMQRHSAKKELQQIAAFNTEFGDMHEEFPTTPEYTPYYEQGLTHLIAMMYYNKDYFRYSKLFEVMIQNGDVSSALAALSSIATNIHCHLSFLFTSRMPGFSLVKTSPEVNYKRGTLHHDSQDPYIHTLLLFPEGLDEKDKQLLHASTQQLIEKLNAASTSEPEIAEISANLSRHVQLLNLNKKHDVAAMYRVATVLLHSMKHKPSNTDRIECVKQLCEAAKDLLLYIEIEKAIVRQAIQTKPRDPSTQDKIANFTKKQEFVYTNVTRFYFDAITMACLGMPQVPIMPEIIEAQTALKNLLTELKAKDKPLLNPSLIKFYEDQLLNTYDKKITERQRLATTTPPTSTPRARGFN